MTAIGGFFWFRLLAAISLLQVRKMGLVGHGGWALMTYMLVVAGMRGPKGGDYRDWHRRQCCGVLYQAGDSAY